MNQRGRLILMAAFLGALAGWIGARAIIRPALTEHDPLKHEPVDIPERLDAPWATYLGSKAPAETTSDAEAFLAARDAEADAAGSPFRFRLRSLDRLESLSDGDLMALLEKGQLKDSTEVDRAFRRLAMVDPEGVLNRLLTGQFIVSKEADQRARERTIGVWVKSDPGGVLAFVEALDASDTRAALAADLVRAWARSDPQAAAEQLATLERLAGPVRGERIANELFSEWEKLGAEQAEAWIRSEAPPERQGELLDLVLLARAAETSPGAAIDLILANPESPALQASLVAHWRRWAMEDPQSAVEKFGELPEDHPMQRHIGDIAQAELALSRDLQTALQRSEQLPEGVVRRRYLQGLVNFGASNDTALALEALPHLPESREREEAMGMLTELWMRRDPEGLSRWLAGLDPSPSRDAAVGRFAELLVESDPEAAEAWEGTLTDEASRLRIQKKLESE